MIRILLSSLVLIAAPAFAQSKLDQSLLASLPHVSFHGSSNVASGRLTPADVELLKRAGIVHVIDLSEDAETPDFDEASAVRAAGMQYDNLPIDGADGLNGDNVRRFDALIKKAGDAPTLIHCASSNRVGALMALRAASLQGKSTEVAIETGESWGLKSLLPAVEQRLKEVSACNATLLAGAPAAIEKSDCAGK